MRQDTRKGQSERERTSMLVVQDYKYNKELKQKNDAYLGYNLSLLGHVLTKRVKVCSKSFTYFKNFFFCYFSREEDCKNIFLNL